jgi:hypothetical protein
MSTTKEGHRIASEVKADILRRIKEEGVSVPQAAKDHGIASHDAKKRRNCRTAIRRHLESVCRKIVRSQHPCSRPCPSSSCNFHRHFVGCAIFFKRCTIPSRLRKMTVPNPSIRPTIPCWTTTLSIVLRKMSAVLSSNRPDITRSFLSVSMTFLDCQFTNANPATSKAVTRNSNAPTARIPVPPTLPCGDIAPLKRRTAISTKNMLAMDGQRS